MFLIKRNHKRWLFYILASLFIYNLFLTIFIHEVLFRFLHYVQGFWCEAVVVPSNQTLGYLRFDQLRVQSNKCVHTTAYECCAIVAPLDTTHLASVTMQCAYWVVLTDLR